MSVRSTGCWRGRTAAWSSSLVPGGSARRGWRWPWPSAAGRIGRTAFAFVDLSPVTDPRLVPEVIAAALGFVGQGREQPIDTLGPRLAGRQMLIVLDNLEQVLDAAPVVADLLQRAPRLHLLVTSRTVLRLRGEQEWRVDSLGLLPASAGLAALAEAPAVRLFLDRVRDVRPGFALTDDNAAAVAELCRRLDGLPLALELAAASMRLLAPGQMLQQLDDRMGRPGALADLPDRQRTLTATLQWSYDLLPESARQLLARLSVFAAPFTAAAAEAVCGWDGLDAAADLVTLLDHSMVTPAGCPDGEPAFRLLDVVRRFASGQLANPDETMGHLEGHLLDVLDKAGAGHGSQGRARRLLDSEQPNLQVVLGWMAGRPAAARPAAAAARESVGVAAGTRAPAADRGTAAANRVLDGSGATQPERPDGPGLAAGAGTAGRRELRAGWRAAG